MSTVGWNPDVCPWFVSEISQAPGSWITLGGRGQSAEYLKFKHQTGANLLGGQRCSELQEANAKAVCGKHLQQAQYPDIFAACVFDVCSGDEASARDAAAFISAWDGTRARAKNGVTFCFVEHVEPRNSVFSVGHDVLKHASDYAFSFEVKAGATSNAQCFGRRRVRPHSYCLDCLYSEAWRTCLFPCNQTKFSLATILFGMRFFLDQVKTLPSIWSLPLGKVCFERISSHLLP